VIQSLPCDETLLCDDTLPCEQAATIFAATPRSLLLTPVAQIAGSYPGVYPGITTFPGGGSGLIMLPVTPRTLTLVPA